MDADEFKRLFLPCHQQLYRVAYRLSGNEQDAQDILQETFLKMWSGRDKLGPIDNPVAFDITTLKHVYVDSLRRRRPDECQSLSSEEVTVASDTDVGRQIESGDALDKVTVLIDSLPDAQRRVMRMRDLADLSMEEIETATGLSPGNIRTLLSRARKKIKEQYIALLKYERL